MLETERIVLRPPIENDLKEIHRLYCDQDIQKYLGGYPNIETSERQLQRAIQDYKKDGYGLMMIFKKEQSSFIGFCKIQSSPLEHPHNIEIIYGLLPEYRGEGYAIESTQVILHWAFNNIDIDQIVGRVKPENTKSLQLLEQLGFERFEDRLDGFNNNEVEHVLIINKSKVLS